MDKKGIYKIGIVVVGMTLLAVLFCFCLLPVLSSQSQAPSGDVSIRVLNPKSFPVVGGNWKVDFVTSGTANLTIKAINGTHFGKSIELQSLECGNQNVNFTWIDNDTIFIPNYFCNETSSLISKELSSGNHTLEFDFGSQVVYAHNFASRLNWIVQSGEQTMNAQSTIVNLATPVNMSHAFILVKRRASTTYDDPSHSAIYTSWVNGTRFTLNQGNTGSFGAIVDWQVIEGGSLYVQNGTQTYTTAQTAFDIPINSVNVSRTAVFMNYGSCGSTSNNVMDEVFWTGNVTSSTNLHIQRDGSGTCAGTVSYYVVEFNDSSFKVQQGDVASMGTSTTVSFNSVNTTNSFFYFSQADTSAANGLNDVSVIAKLASSTSYTLTRLGPGGTVRLKWYMISVPGANIQRGQTSLSSSNNVNVPITSVNTTRSFVLNSFNSSGGGTTWANAMGTARITSSTNLNLQRGTTSNSQDMDWQVIQLPYNPPYVTWNQSTLNLGSHPIENGTLKGVVQIYSFLTNNNTQVSCTSGDCSQISTNFTSINMSDGNYQNVYFTCSNSTVGSFSATYNVTSLQNSQNSYITVSCGMTDIHPPYGNLLTPANGTYVNSASQNLTLEAFDNYDLQYVTLRVWNSTGSLINQTPRQVSGTDTVYGTVYNFPYDGTFIWGYTLNDTSGNTNYTSNNTLTVDTVNPSLQFTTGTAPNDTNTTHTYVYVNTSFSDLNFANVTYSIYDSNNNPVNITTYYTQVKDINWTGLADGVYHYNVSVYDLANNFNSTEIRQIRIDTTPPEITILAPRPIQYLTNVSLPLNVSVSDSGVGLGSCWWNLDGNTNQSATCNQNITFNTSTGSHTLYYYSNDTLGNLDTANVTFQVSVGGIAVALNSPADNSYFNQGNISFDFSANSNFPSDTCILYGNWTGSWAANTTSKDFQWYNKSFNYCMNINISNSGNINLTDYQVLLNLTGNPNMSSDFSDLRFVNASCFQGGNEIPDWQENYSSGSWDSVWVKVPFLTANSNTTISVYYGNNTPAGFDNVMHGQAPELSPTYGEYDNGKNVFNVYDNFAGTNLNTSLWTSSIQSAGAVSVNNGLTLSESTAGNSVFVYLNGGLATDNVTREALMNIYGSTGSDIRDRVNPFYSPLGNPPTNDEGYGGDIGIFSNSATPVYFFSAFTSTAVPVSSSASDYNIIDSQTFLSNGTFYWNSYNTSYQSFYSNTGSFTAGVTLPYAEYGASIDGGQSGTSQIGIQWARVRNYASQKPTYSVGSQQTYYNPYNITLTSDGTYLWNVWCNDTSGQSAFALTNKTFTIDTVNPLVNYSTGTLPNNTYINATSIFVNTTASDLHFANITFNLYNSTNYNLYSDTFTDSTRNDTWLYLPEGTYYYNVTAYDLAGNKNSTETRKITLDTEAPNGTLISPVNNTYTNNPNQNLTVNATDNIDLKNATLNVYNSSGSLINTTTVLISGTQAIVGVVYEFLYDGVFHWFYRIFDQAGNMFVTENNTISVDTTKPFISYSAGTENNNTKFERGWIYVNTTASDLHFANITFDLYNSSGLVNETTYDGNSTEHINWTNLLSANVTYYYNVTAEDAYGNFNSTATRYIELIDIHPPSINIITPKNQTYSVNTSLPLSFTATDPNLDSCWYNLDNSANQTITCNQDTTFDTSDNQGHTLYLYANDTLGQVSLSKVSFFVNTSYIPTGGYSVQRGSVGVNGQSVVPISSVNPSKSFILIDTVSSSSAPSALQVIANFSDPSDLSFWNYGGGTANTEWELIKAPDLQVQRNQETYTSTTNSILVPINSVNLSSSFIIVDNRLNTGTTNAYQDGLWIANFTNSSYIQLHRGTTGAAGEVSWQVVDWKGVVVQNGTTSFTGTSTTASLGSSVVRNESFLIFSGTTSGASTGLAYHTVRSELNPGSVTFTRTSSSGTFTANWFAVSDPLLFNVSNGTTTVTASTSVSIPPLNTSRAFRWQSHDTTGTGNTNANAMISSDITSSTTLALNKGTSSQTNVVDWQTIEIVDRVPPNGTLIGPANNTYTNNPNQNLTVNATDNMELGNATLFVYNSTGDLINTTTVLISGTQAIVGVVYEFLYDGVFHWFYRIFDSSGNLFNTQNNTLTVDTVPPNILFGTGTEINDTLFSRNWVYANVSVSDVNPDNVTFVLYNGTGGSNIVNSTTYSGYSVTNINWTGLADGKYYYKASAADLANNRNSTELRTISLDTTPPSVFIKYPLNTTYNTNVSSLNYTYSDVNPAWCWYSTNGGLSNSSVFSSGANFTNITSYEGSNTWILYCNDSAGNMNTSSVTFFKDTIPPQIKFIPNTLPNDTLARKGWVYANVSLVELNLKNITYSIYNSTSIVNETTYLTNVTEINWTGLPDGTYYYNVSAYDVANNYNLTETRKITLDTTAPNGTLISPANNTYTNNVTQNLTANLTDNFNLNNATLNVYNSSGSLINTTTVLISGTQAIVGVVYEFLYDGVFHWFYRIFDQAGNSFSTSNNTITIDTVNPNVKFVPPTLTNGSYNRQSYITENVSANDTNFANVTSYLYNSSGLVETMINTTKNAFNNFTSLPEGTYYINATARDLAGNFNSTETRTVALDTTPPVIVLNSPQDNNYTRNTAMDFNATVSDNIKLVNVSLYLDNSLNQTNSSGINNSNYLFSISGIPEGIHTWIVGACDAAGNCINSTPRTFTVDLTNPLSFLISLPNGTYTNLSSVNFTINESDNFQLKNSTLYIWYPNGTLLSNANVSLLSGTENQTNYTYTFVKDGTYYWNSLTYDAAGNFAFNSTNYTFVVDTHAPQIQFVPPTLGNDSYKNQTFIPVNVSVSDTNFVNTTISLYNSSGLVETVINTTKNAFNNFTSLPEGTYYINATARDLAGNINSTETREIFLDITPPNASLVSPANNTFTNNATQNLTFSANDSVGLGSAILNVFNSTGNLINTTTVLLSGTQVVGGVVYEFLYDGVFHWFYRIFDQAGNVNVTGNNTITIDTTPPKVLLNSPANGTIVSNLPVHLSSNFTETNNLANATLYVWNSTGSAVNVTTLAISGTSNFTNISVTLPYYDTFKWNYFACDSLDNCAFNSSNRTLIYEAQKVGLKLIYPTSNITVAQNKFFNVTLNISCLAGACGSANTSLYYSSNQWWNTSWTDRQDVNITSVASGTLTNFPVYINLSYASGMNSDYSDLRFLNGSCSQPGGSQLSYEIENYTGSSADVWIKIPSLSPGVNTVCMYYGNPSAANVQNASAVWNNSNYVGVWQLSSNGGNLAVNDVSPNQNNGTNFGATLTSGKVDGAGNFNGTSYVSLPNTLLTSDNFTVSVWFKTTSYGVLFSENNQQNPTASTQYDPLVYVGTTGYLQGGIYSGGYPSSLITSGTVNDGNWHMATYSVTGTTQSLYLDGALAATFSGTPEGTTTYFYMGTGYSGGGWPNLGTAQWYDFNGTIDQMEVSNGALSSQWINQSYQQVSNNSNIITYGGVQKFSGPVSTITGDIPFYTNISNPYTTTSLSKGQSQIVNFWVNATGVGTNTFFAFANLTGNLTASNKTNSWNVTIDNIPPEIKIISPLNRTYNVSNVDFNVSSNEALSMCNFTLNNWAMNYSLQEFNSTYFYTPGFFVNDGLYTAKFWCEDLVGNVNDTQRINFVVDAFGANASLVSPANNTYSNDTTQNLTFSANDSVGLGNATLFVFNSTGDLINTTTVLLSGTQVIGGVVYEFLYDGIFHWFYRIFDTGNHSTTTENNTITIDTTAPLISFGSGTEVNNTNISQSWVYANVSVSDVNPDNVSFVIYNGTNGNHLVNKTVYSGYSVTDVNWTNLQDGKYYYKASAADLANNRNSTELRTITLDTKAPVVRTKFPVNTSYGYNITHLNYTVYDAGVGLDSCWYNINNSANVSIACGQNITTFLTDGIYTWDVYANDTLGHLGKASVTFTVNTQLPTVIIDYPTNMTYNHSVSELNFTAAGNLDTCWYSTDGGATNHTTSCTQNITGLSSLEGPNLWRVYANNSAGGIAYDSVYFSVDTTPPLLTVVSPITDTYYPGNLSFNVSSNENINTCLFSINDWATNYTMNSLNNTYFYDSQNVNPGVYTARFFCNDTVGNINDTVTVPFNVSYPTVLLNVTKPSSNTGILKFTKFNFSVNVTCLVSDCGPINVTLDPLSYWWNNSWYLRQDVNITSVASGTLTNFPTYINLNYIPGMNSDYSDLRFLNGSCSQPGGSQLSYEIENYTGSSADVWIKIPSLSPGVNTVCMYYGNPSAANVQNASAVWNNSYIATYPLSSSSGLLNVSDVSPNQNNGTNFGATLTSGKVDGAGNFNGTGYVSLPNSFISSNEFTVSAWFKTTASGVIFSEQNTANPGTPTSWDPMLYVETTGLLHGGIYTGSIPALESSSAVNDGNWHRASLVVDTANANQSLYLDGNYVGSVTGGTIEGPYTYWYLGTGYSNTWTNTNNAWFYLNGAIDQVEVSNALRSSQWINQSYQQVANQNNLISYGAVQAHKGVISTTTGAQPFYATQNPIVTSSLSKGQSQVINFTVNATGFPSVYTFFAFGNLTKNESVSNFSNYRNITITTNAAPLINLTYPENDYNFSSYHVPQFNFTVNDSNYHTCELWGNWTGSWTVNQTLGSVQPNVNTSFSGINTSGDGIYKWNVRCTDGIGDYGWNANNYTFTTFLPPTQAVLVNVTQTNNNGTGNITLYWNATNHTTFYRIYAGNNLTNLTYLNTTNKTNYTDTTFAGHVRRFYQVVSGNPVTQNYSSGYFGAHVYTLYHTASTKNWIAFPTNFTYLETANQTKNDIPNVTSITTWNATIQKGVTCNDFSCPDFPSCTSTNCNFNLQKGQGYEVGVNSSAPSSYNWSGVGIVYNMSNITLVKNSSSFGKNWISLGANTSLENAYDMLNNITNADTVSRWNPVAQTSEGYLYVSLPGWNYYVGTNFPTKMEEGYEVSVTTTENWTQI